MIAATLRKGAVAERGGGGDRQTDRTERQADRLTHRE